MGSSGYEVQLILLWSDSYETLLLKLELVCQWILQISIKRLPKARVIASDIIQKLDSVYMALPGVIGIADIIVYGRAELEHDGNLILFLKTTRKNGL